MTGAKPTLRRWWRRWVPAALELVYHERYQAAVAGLPYDPLRAERILAFLLAQGLAARNCVHRPRPASLRALTRTHGGAYLESVHETGVLGSIMGSEVTPAQVDRLLDHARLQTGGTQLAVRRALRHGLACNLGGGFHHAHADRGGGFCVFNDVAVAIAAQRRFGFTGRVLVVDLDLHDGDGTRAIFADDASIHTLSIHARHWEEIDAVESTSVELGDDVGDATYLAAIEEHVPTVFAAFRPALVVYLAGADPADGDHLGNWSVSAEALLERDLRVTRMCREASPKVPLAITLAGGYGPDSWRLSGRYLSALLHRGRALEPPPTEEITLERYRYLAALFEADRNDEDDENFGLSEADLELPGATTPRDSLLFGRFTRHGVELVLERSGVLDRLLDLGYPHPTLDFDLRHAAGETLTVYSDPAHSAVLAELRLRRDRRTLPGLDLLSIEWLLLQNPRAEWSPARPRLPGQSHPGLGMLQDVVAMLVIACERLGMDGLVFVPSQFHIAHHWRRHLRFVDPDDRARFAAVIDLLGSLPLLDAIRALEEERVVADDGGEVFRWQPAPMVLPVSERLKRRLAELDAEAEPGSYRFTLLAEQADDAATPVDEGSGMAP